MSKSYRIRTTPGVDKSINVLLDQDFEYLEILSLKLLQSEIYTRQCSDYGVIVGRVSVNNGFGIPNAKVSVFIPLDSQDSINPVISDLYPYRTLSDVNEDGYRYNLLPYRRSHSGHNPTGTFFDRDDVLTNPTLIEVFDKYYKYTATTNESGDYMIFGVPVGSQTVVLDVDLSDIGEFSLSPQDLIRMGVATESQVSGVNFKSGTNLRELPQIININRVIQVEPLWGQPEICNLGITRTDFDLTTESNIEITPTAIFMGSIFSTEETGVLKRNCKPSNKMGSLCSLTAGPGEILAIRQTIFNDNQGRPVLEQFQLEQGGDVIDDNGVWLIDVPMNLDFVTTNEFGEQILSNNPKIGIPTKGKYRFKIKWNQSESLSTPIRRANFLVPNIKEYGWLQTNNDPTKLPNNDPNKILLNKSYAFSLNWDDYVNPQEAIDCEDTFYLMGYNKVYTVSQLVDQFRKGWAPNRIIAVKNILDDSCDSTVNKFPSNDAVFRFDLIYFLFWIMLFLFRPIFIVLIPVIHILWFVLKIVSLVLTIILVPLLVIFLFVCNIIRGLLGILSILPFGIGRRFRRLRRKMKCITFKDIRKIIRDINSFPDKLKNIKIPNLSYPECSFCDCGNNDNLPKEQDGIDELTVDDTDASYIEGDGSTILSQFQINGNYLNRTSFSGSTVDVPGVYTLDLVYQNLFSGDGLGDPEDETLTSGSRVPELIISSSNDSNPESENPDIDFHYFTSSLTLYERLNLFNTKAKYFNKNTDNPGGGVNRVKVQFQPQLNPSTFHYDNVIAIVVNENTNNLTEGTLVSFQNPNLSGDINVIGDGETLNEFGTYSIIGEPINVGTITNPSSINIEYANPDNSGNINITYNVIQNDDDANYAKFSIDIEYFQVIKNLTVSDYSTMINPNITSDSTWSNEDSFPKRFLFNEMKFYRIRQNTEEGSSKNVIFWDSNERLFSPLIYYKNYENQKIIFLVRGVDPNSTRNEISYDLSRLFGYNFGDGPIVTGNFKLNHPINGNIKSYEHTDNNNLTSNLFYNSFHFRPNLTPGLFGFSSFTTNLQTYYSNLDNTNLAFKPDNNQTTPTLNYSVNSGPSGTISVKKDWNGSGLSNSFNNDINGDNGFIVEWENKGTRECFVTPFTIFTPYRMAEYPNNNGRRGYYRNEVIEGGSLFYQKLIIIGCRPNIEYISHYYSPRYSENLTMTISLNNSNPEKIVMRSDRLPTSTIPQDNLNNSFFLHSNTDFEIITFTDDGVAQQQNTSQSGSQSLNIGGEDFSPEENLDEPGVLNNVINSFSCGEMAPLGCYKSSSDDSEIIILPKSDDCWKFGGGKRKMDGGCYILITQPILSLFRDFGVVLEWTTRVQTIFGACRNVFSHLFTNNWVNGSLYMFPFKNDVFYTSPFSNRPNQPFSRFCGNVIYLDGNTNNFYYRSSPWNNTSELFIGQDGPGYNGNNKNLKYPTTMIDLGPRNEFLQELIMSDDFDGYVVKKLDTTTYGDVSDLLNMLIITRLANESFLSQLGGVGIASMFGRPGLMIDGDYAQMNSINSELGVAPFDSTNYSQSYNNDQDPIFYKSGGINSTVFGVFFSSDTITRDYITPKRTIINSTLTSDNECSFSNINVFSQKVPFYQWRININNDSTQYIFGTQGNNWSTNPLPNNGFFSSKYQDLDRLNPDSRYFRTNGSVQTQYNKGYIYAVNGDNSPLNLSANITNWELNSDEQYWITVGAPYHFYFGLYKGKSAFDRFRKKWINSEIIID
jgi:hypothetical protein